MQTAEIKVLETLMPDWLTSGMQTLFGGFLATVIFGTVFWKLGRRDVLKQQKDAKLSMLHAALTVCEADFGQNAQVPELDENEAMLYPPFQYLPILNLSVCGLFTDRRFYNAVLKTCEVIEISNLRKRGLTEEYLRVMRSAESRFKTRTRKEVLASINQQVREIS